MSNTADLFFLHTQNCTYSIIYIMKKNQIRGFLVSSSTAKNY